jgi:hypothetical protein
VKVQIVFLQVSSPPYLPYFIGGLQLQGRIFSPFRGTVSAQSTSSALSYNSSGLCLSATLSTSPIPSMSDTSPLPP